MVLSNMFSDCGTLYLHLLFHYFKINYVVLATQVHFHYIHSTCDKFISEKQVYTTRVVSPLHSRIYFNAQGSMPAICVHFLCFFNHFSCVANGITFSKGVYFFPEFLIPNFTSLNISKIDCTHPIVPWGSILDTSGQLKPMKTTFFHSLLFTV